MRKIYLFLLLTVVSVHAAGLFVDKVISSPGSIELHLSIDQYSISPRADGTSAISIDNCGYRGEIGAPALAGRSFFVATPTIEAPEVELSIIRWSDWTDITPAPVPNRENRDVRYKINNRTYNIAQPVRAEYIESAVMRGVNFAIVDYIPVEYDPLRGVRFALKATLHIDYRPDNFHFDERLFSPVYHRLLGRLLVNADDVLPPHPRYFDGPWHSSDGAELLIITPTIYTSDIENWVSWKFQSGIPTRVVTTTETGTTRGEIKSYIINAYATWEIPPSYVLFIGDTEILPTYDFGAGGLGDGPYGCITGSDIFPEVMTGRLSCDNSSQLAVLIRKCLNFEYMPDTTDNWYARAVGIVNEDDPYLPLGPGDSSYAAAVIYAMEQCSLSGFSSYPVFRDLLGHSTSDVQPYIEAGCAFTTYRGQATSDWYNPFRNLNLLNTGIKCPITVSITCMTGAFQYDSYHCENSTRAGTVSSPNGSVVWIGQATVSSNTPERSSLSKHIFEGFFPAELNEVAAAHLYGKNEMLAEFGLTYNSEAEYTTSTLIGSPEMRAWTAPIETPEVVYLPAIVPGADFDVTVSVDGSPITGARVALTQDTLMSYAISDAAGEVSLDFFPILDPLIPIVLVVSGPNIYPHIDTLELSLPGVALLPAPIEFVEIEGNGDDLINPGETHSFVPRIVNLGTDTAVGLEGLMLTPWDFIWSDSSSSFPDIATFDTVSGTPIEFYVPADYETEDSLVFEMFIDDHPDGPWFIDFPNFPRLNRFSLQIDSIDIRDNMPYGNDNDKIDPGETVTICVQLSNPGYGLCDSLTAVFSSSNDSIKIMSGEVEHGYWDILASDFLNPCFCIDVSPELGYEPSREFLLPIDANCNTYEYHDTLPISFEFGTGSTESSPWLFRFNEPELQDLGDGDGIIEPGERVGIVLEIKNGGGLDASAVHAGVSPTPFVYSDGHTSLIGNIPSGAIVENTTDAITCTTAHYTPEDTTVEVPILLLDSGSSYSHTIKVYLPLGTGSEISESPVMPGKITIGRFSPNPFNSSGEFEIRLHDKMNCVSILAYDILGNLVKVIQNGEMSAGTHRFTFAPKSFSSGIYLINVRAGDFKSSFKAILLK